MKWDDLMRTIMIVDDEPGVQEQIRIAMRDTDARVIHALDSRSALSMLDDTECDLMLVRSVAPVSMEPVLVPIKPTERYMLPTSQSFLKKPFTDKELIEFLTLHTK